MWTAGRRIDCFSVRFHDAIGGIAGLRADVSVWVPVVQAAVGVITVVGAFFAARIGATRQDKSTQQREAADARAEWFRRLQWASLG